MNKAKKEVWRVWHEKTVDKVGKLYIGTIYQLTQYDNNPPHRNLVWCGECVGATTKKEALKYMTGKVART